MPAVAGSFPAFWWQIRATRENRRCTVTQTLGVLANRCPQFGEDRLHFVGALGGDRPSAEFSNTIIDARPRKTMTPINFR